MEDLTIPTPDFSHLTKSGLDDVYEPAEDSFLLLDALESEMPELVRHRPSLCVEIGLGSGVISTALSSALKRHDCPCLCIGTDVNPSACRVAAATAAKAAAQLEVLRADCLSPFFADRLRGSVDVLVCNPPYVETGQEETGTVGISAAWAGGQFGRDLTDRVVALCAVVLSERMGRCYLVVEQCNKPDRVVEFANRLGLDCSEVVKRRAGRELLYVYKIERAK
jgi:release factor glutamine methyltransferase